MRIPPRPPTADMTDAQLHAALRGTAHRIGVDPGSAERIGALLAELADRSGGDPACWREHLGLLGGGGAHAARVATATGSRLRVEVRIDDARLRDDEGSWKLTDPWAQLVARAEIIRRLRGGDFDGAAAVIGEVVTPATLPARDTASEAGWRWVTEASMVIGSAMLCAATVCVCFARTADPVARRALYARMVCGYSGEADLPEAIRLVASSAWAAATCGQHLVLAAKIDDDLLRASESPC